MYNFSTFNTRDVRDNISEFLDLIAPLDSLGHIPSDKHTIAYGCGDLGRMCKQFCRIEELEISAYVDANFEKVSSDSFWHNENVQPREYLQGLSRENTLIIICVVNFPLQEIFEYLSHLGFENILTFYDFAEQTKSVYPLQNGWLADQQIFDKKRAKKVAAYLKDNQSVAHYLSFIAWRFARKEWAFEEHSVETGNRFLINEVKEHLSGQQVLLDIGAHIGSVAIQFDEYLKGDLKKIICFEPDEKNRSLLNTHLAKKINPATEFEIFSDVLWSGSEEIKFSQGHNYASCIDASGDIRTSRTMDSFDLEPTIIKIHTEGSELDIVKGGLRTIQKTRPVIMLTVYHNAQGIYETLEFLNQYLDDYDVIFRNHSWAGTGAVIYCFPHKLGQI